MKPLFLRTPYNYDRNEASLSSSLRCLDDSKTKQSFAEECDINTIVRRFNLTGQLPENVHAPTYADFSEVMDFQSAMNSIVSARESFDAMPADTRAVFHNDPQEFVEFCSNADNIERMIKMGLAVRKPDPVVEPIKAPETPETSVST